MALETEIFLRLLAFVKNKHLPFALAQLEMSVSLANTNSVRCLLLAQFEIKHSPSIWHRTN